MFNLFKDHEKIIEEHKSIIATKENIISDLNTRYDLLKSPINEAEGTIIALEKRVKELESENAELKEKLACYEGESTNK